MSGQAACVKRLMKDLKQLQRHPLVGAAAAPVGREDCDDLTLWDGCVQVAAPGGGRVPVYFLLAFPDEYPLKAPSLGFQYRFSWHMGASNVEVSGRLKGKTTVCLNILSDFAHAHGEWEGAEGSGWSSSYTTSTLLLLMQSVLADLPQVLSAEAFARLKQDAATFEREHPEHVLEMEDGDDEGDEGEEKNENAPTAAAPDVVVQCCVEGVDHTEDVLGMLVRQRGGLLVPSCERLSAGAWARGVRRSTTREPYTHYLPLWINPAHAAAPAWRELLDSALAQLARPGTDAALDVFARALAGLLDVLFDEDVARAASVAQFEGYVNLWRTLRAVLEAEEPARRGLAGSVEAYVRDGTTPRGGEAVVLAMFVAGYGLPGLPADQAFVEAYAGAISTRAVRLQCGIGGIGSQVRPCHLRAAFQASAADRCLLMLSLLVRDVLLQAGPGATPAARAAEAAAAMDATQGTVPDRLEALLVAWKAARERVETGGWSLWYAQIRCAAPWWVQGAAVVEQEEVARGKVAAEWRRGLLAEEEAAWRAPLARAEAAARVGLDEAQARAGIAASWRLGTALLGATAAVVVKEDLARRQAARAEAAAWVAVMEADARVSLGLKWEATLPRLPPALLPPALLPGQEAVARVRAGSEEAAARAALHAAAAAGAKAARRQAAAAAEALLKARREALQLQRQAAADRQAEMDQRAAAARRAERQAAAEAARKAERKLRTAMRAARRAARSAPATSVPSPSEAQAAAEPFAASVPASAHVWQSLQRMLCLCLCVYVAGLLFPSTVWDGAAAAALQRLMGTEAAGCFTSNATRACVGGLQS